MRLSRTPVLRFTLYDLPRLDLYLTEEIGNFPASGIRPVRSVHGVLLHVGAPVTTNRVGVGFGRIGRAHNAAVGLNRILTFEHRNQSRARRHKRREAIKKRTFFMDGIESLGLYLA